MRANEYLVLSECVEEGIAYGWMRAHKHADSPTEESIKDAIHNSVMASISEYFLFDEVRDDN